MQSLAEIPVSTEADITTLSRSGLALAMWDSVRRRDRHAGTLITLSTEPEELVGAALPIVTHLLSLAAGSDPLTDVADACRMLLRVAEGGPAAPLVEQMLRQFDADPHRAWIRVENVNAIQVTIMMEAGALLVRSRTQVSVEETFEGCRARVAVDRARVA